MPRRPRASSLLRRAADELCSSTSSSTAALASTSPATATASAFPSPSPEAAVARSLYRALLLATRRLDRSEATRALVSTPPDLAERQERRRNRRSPFFSSSALPREIVADSLSRHFLKGKRLYDPRRSGSLSLEGAVRSSFREARAAVASVRSPFSSTARERNLDAGFCALRYLGGIAAVAERHGLLVSPSPSSSEPETATATATPTTTRPLLPTTAQRLSRPATGTLLIPHPAARGAHARTPVLLLEVLESETEGEAGGAGRSGRRRQRKRATARAKAGDGGAAALDPFASASSSGAGLGAMGIALGSPFAVPVADDPEREQQQERRRDRPLLLPLRVSDLAATARPLPRFSKVISALSERGKTRTFSPSEAEEEREATTPTTPTATAAASSRCPGVAGLALLRKSSDKEGDEALASLLPPRREKERGSAGGPLSVTVAPLGVVASTDFDGPSPLETRALAVTVSLADEEGDGIDDYDEGEFDSDTEEGGEKGGDEAGGEADGDGELVRLLRGALSLPPPSTSVDELDRVRRDVEEYFEEGEEGTEEEVRDALAIGVDVGALVESDDESSRAIASSRVLWGGPVPGVTLLSTEGSAGGDEVVLREPSLEGEEREEEGRRRRRRRGLLSRHRQRRERRQNVSPPPPPARKKTSLYIDGDARKLLSSSRSDRVARVFVGASFWKNRRLRSEVDAGAWFVAAVPPGELVDALRGGSDDGAALWARCLTGMGMGGIAALPEAAVEEVANGGVGL